VPDDERPRRAPLPTGDGADGLWPTVLTADGPGEPAWPVGYGGVMTLLSRRRVSCLVLACAFGAGALVTSTALGGSVSAATGTLSSVLTTAKAAIARQSGVHFVINVTQGSPSLTENIVGDWGKTSGDESITRGNAAMHLRVTPSDAYLSGNSSGLTEIFGLTAPQAGKLGKRWMSFKSTTGEYTDLARTLEISSAVGVLPKAKGTKLSTKTVKGTRLYLLSWTVAATSSSPKLSFTLTMPVSGATLPRVEKATTTTGGVEIITFSKWGEHLVVATPPVGSTIDSSKITG
jgi:hypothetical protein